VSKNKFGYTSENQQKSHFIYAVLAQRISLSFLTDAAKCSNFSLKVKPK
jgi:hypothetical protein